MLVRVLSGKRTVQTERAAGHKGSDTVKLRTLHRGRYQLVVSATDSKGRTGLAQQSITVR